MASAPFTLKEVRLDEPLRCGETTVAAIVEQTVLGIAFESSAFVGEKRPLAVLVHHLGRTVAFWMDGTPIHDRELETRFPGRRAELERQLQSQR